MVLSLSFFVLSSSFNVAPIFSILCAIGNLNPCYMGISLVLPHYGPKIIEQKLWNEASESISKKTCLF